MKFQHIVILCVFVLIGCGGGGSGSSPVPAKVDQVPLVFSANNIDVVIDEMAPSNSLSGGSGSGAISYNSNNPAVASVNTTTGALTVVSAGEAIITATKAADVQYNSASTQYRIIVHLKQQTPLVFSQSELSVYLNSAPPQNALSGGSGLGAITYSSSDTDVLIVDPSTGTLEAVSVGEVHVTATKAADNTYSKSSAIYTVNVKKILEDLEIGIGVLNTEFKWKAQSDAVKILRSTDANCNFAAINSCADNSDISVTERATHIDSLINLFNPAYVILETNGYRSQVVIAKPMAADISKRYGSAYFVFAGKVWAMGGMLYNYDDNENVYNPTYFNDLWSSTDGISWRLEKEDTGIFADYNFQVINYHNELYLVGGIEGVQVGGFRSAGIWKSTDAREWQLIQNNPSFGAFCESFYTFNDKLWCYSGGQHHNGFWSSTDGISWIKEGPAIAFNRSEMVFYTANNKLFMAAGCENCKEENYDLKNDIWSTTDGITWIKELEHALFPPLANANIIWFKGTWVLTGGYTENGLHDKSLVSDDGIHWRTLGNDVFGVGPHGQHEIINFKDELYLYPDVSAYSPSGPLLGITQGVIWKSSDGASWRIPLKTDFQWAELNN